MKHQIMRIEHVTAQGQGVHPEGSVEAVFEGGELFQLGAAFAEPLIPRKTTSSGLGAV